MVRTRVAISLAITTTLIAATAFAEMPQGYFVWVKGDLGNMASRKIYRMTLPERDDVKALTSGEDVECQISPDGKWVAYAKAKLANSDYHLFNRFWLYIVSVHGVGDGREEIKIDDNGYWPSWGPDNTLIYSQVDNENASHTRIMKVSLDDYGNVVSRAEVFRTASAFSNIDQVNECFMAPDQSWFVGRTRGNAAVSGVGAFRMDPADFSVLARAGSVGCMPYIAPSSSWGFIAGRDQGIRWGDSPNVANGQSDQQLVAPRSSGGFVYHPGISSDENWFMAAHSSADDHNSGPYDIYLYKLNGRAVSDEQLLAGGGFNGWPHLWVGMPSEPPPPRPHIDEFFPESYTIIAGEPVVLHWKTSFADSVFLNAQAVALDGEQSVSPTSTQHYELTAQSALVTDTDSSSLDITVNATAQPVQIASFVADLDRVVAGDTVVLQWRVENATTLDLDGRAVAPVASLEVNPTVTSTYVLTAQGHQGPQSSSVTVTVVALADLHPPLLEDRGGFVCTAANPQQSAAFLTLLGALCLLRRRNSAK